MSRENQFKGTIDIEERPDFTGERNLEAIRKEFNTLELDHIMDFDEDMISMTFAGGVHSNHPFNATNFQLAESLAYLAFIAWENGFEMVSLDYSGGVMAKNEIGMMKFTVANGKVWVDKISFALNSNDFPWEWESDIEVKITRRLGDKVAV